MNLNSLLPKIDDIHYIAKQSNASIIGISKSKLDSTILNSEVDIENKCLRTEGGVAYYIRKSLSYNHKSTFCGHTKTIFINIFLPKSKSILVAMLHWPPNKLEFIERLDNSLKENNICHIQECYPTVDFIVNLLSRNKMLLKKNILTTADMLQPQLKNTSISTFSTPSIN